MPLASFCVNAGRDYRGVCVHTIWLLKQYINNHLLGVGFSSVLFIFVLFSFFWVNHVCWCHASVSVLASSGCFSVQTLRLFLVCIHQGYGHISLSTDPKQHFLKIIQFFSTPLPYFFKCGFFFIDVLLVSVDLCFSDEGIFPSRLLNVSMAGATAWCCLAHHLGDAMLSFLNSLFFPFQEAGITRWQLFRTQE